MPLHHRFDWRKPPLITLLLVTISVLVFFGFQLDDNEQYVEAVTYYHDSGLAEIELTAARNYAGRSDDLKLQTMLSNVDEEAFPFWAMELQTNVSFMRALHHDDVITITTRGYEEWKEKRQRFDQLYEAITIMHYGLRTAQPSVITLFSHMFLHADFWHLFGNMVFLLAVGMLVEPTMDRASFLVSYLAAGLGSAGFDLVLRGNELIPGIGASGAIAGLMGAFAVLYGFKRIRFFYFVGVYFDYTTLPALVLLPLWITNELIQMVINAGSGVNYLAHVGGLCSGALIALVVKRTVPSFNVAHVEEHENQEKFALDLRRVRELMEQFRPEAALPLLRRLRGEHPEHREVLVSSYACSRVSPASDEYHALAHAIFSLQDTDAATDRLVLETFNEYLRMARPATRMTGTLVCGLAKRFLRQKAVEQAERLVRIILAKKLPCQESRRLLEEFVALLEERGRGDDVVGYRQYLPLGEHA